MEEKSVVEAMDGKRERREDKAGQKKSVATERF